ncbi:MAG: MFS transporter [Clostridia bacterium]|nr:MFS transporter [Clostridia bacterium]
MTKKLTKKWQLVLYGCSGLGINMMGMIVGTYLCSALLVGGFEDNVENWTYLNRDLVIAGLWATLILVSKIVDGVIDIPFASWLDNLRTKWGRRRPALLGGMIITMAVYCLFLIPLDKSATLLNTIWFAFLLMVFYSAYTLTMLCYYATFSEIVEKDSDRVFLSNTKSICDVVYFSMSFALVPVFVGMGVNIRYVALIFLPLALLMLIPMFLIKESSTKDGVRDENGEMVAKRERVSLVKSFAFSFKNKKYLFWLLILSVMNFGLQLFLNGINEFFSTTGMNMTFVMASAFAPVPLTLIIYNKLIKKYGLRVAYQYALFMFSLGMGLMFFCQMITGSYLLPFAIFCSLLTSFGIGAFFSVTYMIPSQLAKEATDAGEKGANAMYFAVQGLFEGISAGLASGIVLVYLKQSGHIDLLTLIVAISCLTALVIAFFMPKSIALLGKAAKKDKE